jgi:hypothetical protein
MISIVRAVTILRVATALAVALSLSACGGTTTNSDTATPTAKAASPVSTASDTPTASVTASGATSTVAQSVIEFSSAAYSVAQNAQSVTLTAKRTGTATAAISVDYATHGETARAGVDYKGMNGTLQWAENDSTPRTIVVVMRNITPYLGTKIFQVRLSNPSAAAQLGTPDSPTVTVSGDATPSAGALVLSATSYAVSQSAGTRTVTVNRIGGASGAVSVAYGSVGGTAVAGVDFTAVSGTLQWGDGDATSKSFTVPISKATPFLGSKSFRVALSNPLLGAALGSPSSANVTIGGDASPPAGSLQLSAPSYPVTQNAGSVAVTSVRTGGSNGALSVAYATSSGTAVAGTDFIPTTGTLHWASGDATAKTFTVPISNAAPFSGNKTLTVALSSPSGGATISNPGSASVTIAGDAVAPVGSLKLSAPSYAVAQGAGTVTVAVDRTGGSAGAVNVAYASSTATAVVGSDYTGVNGILKWADGDASAKTFTVAISNATPFSGSKSFGIILSNPGGGTTLSTPNSANVVITGDAAAALGSLQLAAASYTVAQTAGTLAVTVHRTGGSSGAVSVAYATSGGTAVSGADYTPASGTLNWADGDVASKSFEVTLSNSTPFAGGKSFNVTLSSPSGGATLSTPSSAAVTITGSSGAGSGPSAVTDLQLINQGGPGNTIHSSAASLTNYQQISWNAATPGANPIASYNIYRNGVLYANTAALTYIDKAATNSNSPTWVTPATVYSYNVAAVDSKGNVGPQAAQMSAYSYRNGASNWSNADLSYDGVVGNENYSSIAGNPQGGPFDISVLFPNGGFQPAADAPQAPLWDLEVGAFNHFVIDVNPGAVISQYVQIGIVSRLPPGDVYSWASALNIFDYGPAPIANTWATYKVPLKAFNMGVGSFTGSISGTKLTVTAVSSGGVDAGGFVTGPGVPAGTYITAYGQRASIGTFTVAGPGISAATSVPAAQMTFQRTSLYKFFIQPETNPVTLYLNNMGFTVN